MFINTVLLQLSYRLCEVPKIRNSGAGEIAQMVLQALGSIMDSPEPTVKSQEQWYM